MATAKVTAAQARAALKKVRAYLEAKGKTPDDLKPAQRNMIRQALNTVRLTETHIDGIEG